MQIPFDHYIAVSNHTKSQLRKKCQLIYPGLDLTGYPEHKGGTHYLFTGRMAHAKGIDVLIRGFHLFLETGHENQLHIVCPSLDNKIIRWAQAYIGRHNLEDHIVFFHDISESELLKKISRAKAGIVPSLTEGFGYSAAKIVGIGCPVIATRTGSLPEVIGGKHIWMDNLSPEILSEALEKSENDKWEYKNKPFFQVDHMIEKFEALYLEVVQ
jgi:glycosyltransferase involved in cell wall biosynthesis